MLYQVHYRNDDRHGTSGACKTDYSVEKGETIYAKNGRATVVSCHEVTERAAHVVVGRNGGIATSTALQHREGR